MANYLNSAVHSIIIFKRAFVRHWLLLKSISLVLLGLQCNNMVSKLWVEKTRHQRLLPITSPNINRFPHFFSPTDSVVNLQHSCFFINYTSFRAYWNYDLWVSLCDLHRRYPRRRPAAVVPRLGWWWTARALRCAGTTPGRAECEASCARDDVRPSFIFTSKSCLPLASQHAANCRQWLLRGGAFGIARSVCPSVCMFRGAAA